MTSNAESALILTIFGRLARCLRERASRHHRADPSRFPAEAAMASAFDALADELEAASREPRPAEPAMIHDVVGRRFRAWDGHVYVCDGYDPGCGYWMTREDAPPDRRQDQEGEWRRNVSERAIGRTYHRLPEGLTPTPAAPP